MARLRKGAIGLVTGILFVALMAAGSAFLGRLGHAARPGGPSSDRKRTAKSERRLAGDGAGFRPGESGRAETIISTVPADRLVERKAASKGASRLLPSAVGGPSGPNGAAVRAAEGTDREPPPETTVSPDGLEIHPLFHQAVSPPPGSGKESPRTFSETVESRENSDAEGPENTYPAVLPPSVKDRAAQLSARPMVSGLTGVAFDGLTGAEAMPAGAPRVYNPSDVNGAAGDGQYVQFANSAWAVFTKAGQRAGIITQNQLWGGLGDVCATANDGDGVVAFDKAANRWVLTQFAGYSTGTVHLQCVAVSRTPDALGAYRQFSFSFGNDLNDYPKLGVWPDGYYMTFPMFHQIATDPNTYQSPSFEDRVCVLDRIRMLSDHDVPGPMLCRNTTVPPPGQSTPVVHLGLLPADWDGAAAPPAASPNYLMSLDPDGLHLDLWRFSVNWTNLTATLAGPTFVQGVAAFNYLCPDPPLYGVCIPQPRTVQQLDSKGDRLMHRLAYRNIAGQESLVTNHTVDVGGGQGAVRWYEVRNPGATPTVSQQGTYAPDPSHRWMGSAGMDRNGDLLLSYSVSGTIAPSIRYSGRLVGDPPGILQAESELIAGPGVQVQDPVTFAGWRWGDYSGMAIDPVDDCTFWFTNQYLPADGVRNWNTRVGSFRFPSCLSRCPAIGLAPASLPAARTATPYSQALTASGGTAPYEFFVSTGQASLPPGLTLDTNGILHGTPTVAGTFAFSVTASDSGRCAGTSTLTLVVSSCPTITVAPASLPVLPVSVFFSQTLTASGSVGPYTFSIVSGSPPSGLTLTPGGLLSGTPSVAGLSSFTVQARDASGNCTGTAAYSLGVCGALTVTPPALSSGTVGVLYNQTVGATGGSGAYVFTVTSGALPSGLSLSAAGVLSGTPTTAGSSTFTIQAVNTGLATCSGVRTYTVTVAPDTPPSIAVAAPLARAQGSPGAVSQIATVSDGETAAGSLFVKATSVPAGLTLTGISNNNGAVSASIAASCTLSAGAYLVGLQVSDGTLTASSNLTVNVSANPLPALGGYSATSVPTGGTAAVTPTVPPSDNGSVVSLTASAPGFAGSITAAVATGVVTISGAFPVGSYTVTLTATDNCGAVKTTTFPLTVTNTAPTITPVGSVQRQQGSPASASQVATVVDAETPRGNLIVTATVVPAGLTVTGITNVNGTISAAISAACTATAGTNLVRLQVSDGSLTATADLTVLVTANAPPVLGTYANATVAEGGSGSVSPSSAPSDNGSVSSVTVSSSPAYPGALAVLPSTGVVTIGNPPSGGTFTMTVSASDNCGATASRTFSLTVVPLTHPTAIAPSSGSTLGGTRVIITGTAFQSGATATVGGLALTSASVTATTISGTTQAHAAGTVDVVVANPGGGQTPLPLAYTYVVPLHAPTNLAFNVATRALSWTPPDNALPSDSISYDLTVTNTGFTPPFQRTYNPTLPTSYTLGPEVTAGSFSWTLLAKSSVRTSVSPAQGPAINIPLIVTAISPITGSPAGGTPVTITGSNFRNIATVTIGGTAATAVNVASSTTITAVTGPHVAGLVNVVVTLLDSPTGTLPNGYTYGTPPPAPTGLSPSGNVSLPETTTLAPLSWNASPGAVVYAVRAIDVNVPNSQVFNNCNTPPQPPIYYCRDGVTGLGDSLPVQPGHNYQWWVQAISASGDWSAISNASFSVIPASPTSLVPNGTVFANTTTSAALTWGLGFGATQSAVRVEDLTNESLRDPRNNCSGVYLCVDGVAGTTDSVPVQAGHKYKWWVHAGNSAAKYSAPTYAAFCVALAQSAAPAPDSLEALWVDDQIPPGAVAAGTWVWDTTQKASGTQSNTEPSAPGLHQHYFSSASVPLTIGAADTLVAYVLLDPCDPPQEVMLQWLDPIGGWEHRAFWGPDLIPWGVPGTAAHVSAGPLPAAGQWVKLAIPASTAGLAGPSINGMAFTLYGGHAWFDRAGVLRAPVDDAAFVSQIPPPACMFPGSSTAVSVTMRNTGNTVWDSTYRLGSQNPQDNVTWSLGRVFLAAGETVPPGLSKTFNFNVTMPTTPGTYNFQWRMVHEGVHWFGAFTPNVTSTNAAPSAPTGLSPNGTAYPAGTPSVTLSWSPTPGATRYAVRVQDNTDGTLRDPRNNCPGVYLCVNDIASTNYSVPVISGHSYTWWVQAGNCAAYSAQTTATFTVAAPTPPPSPTGLTPNGVALPAGSTAVTMSWSATPGADRYAVRLQDNTDGSLRSTWSCPGTPTIYLCVNDIGPNSYASTVVPGHSYTWWVHAGNVYGYSAPTYASFSVPVAPLHAPTGLYKDAASTNLIWTPPDNLTTADQVSYDLWIYGGPNCASGCLFHPGAPSWYTMGPSISTGSYSWTLKANSASRPSSGAVSGPSFTMP